MNRSNLKVARSLAIIWLVLALAACHRAPDEVRVRQSIAQAAEAAEAGDAAGVVEALSEDFSGNDGELGRSRLAGMLRLARLRGEHVGVALGPVRVEPRGDRLMARFTATLTSGGRILPAQLGVYQVQTAWRKDGGDWVCYWAKWTQPL